MDIVKSVNDSRLRICMDIGHANVYSKIPVLEWIEHCKEYISHFHIHNNDGTRDSHSEIEQGTISTKKLFEVTEKLCPDASYTIEMMNAEASVEWIMKLKN